MQALKRKLENLRAEEEMLHNQSSKRVKHLRDLYEIPSLVDTKYDQWSRTRLDRLMVDYLLRSGHAETATALAKAKDITHLIDLDTFIACHNIAASIRRGETKKALSWINENRNALKKITISLPSSNLNSQSTFQALQSSNLEFELHLQQYVTLISTDTIQSRLEARAHAIKHLTPHPAARPEALRAIAGLLAHSPPTSPNAIKDLVEPYRSLFAPARWDYLSDLFVETHHALFGVPSQPLLHTALSAGLSALKTPACHSVHNPASASTTGHARIASNSSLCPICSTELNELAKNVPYAHHTKSYVEPDAVVLPNDRIYGRARLEELQRKIIRAAGGNGGIIDDDMIGIKGEATDPITNESFPWKDVRKVYIT